MYDRSFSWTSSQCFTPEDAVERVCMYERRMCPTLIQAFPLYLEALQSSRRAHCITVWVKGTVAYRCRTCQVNDTSAICQECFLKGEHKQHDYEMYPSGSGGCCDCGNPEFWQELGFCSAHRSVDRQDHSLPAELEGPTKNSVSEVLGMLSFIISYIPDINGGPPVSQKTRIETAMVFLEWLQMLCSVDALRKIVCSEIVQRNVTDLETRELKAPLQILLKMFSSMPEEIMEAKKTLFLQMLYNSVFKHQYTEELMDNYQTMIESVVDTNITDIRPFDPLIKQFESFASNLDTVMMHISNAIAMEFIRSKNLLRIFVMSYCKILRRCVRRDLGDLLVVMLNDDRGTNVVSVIDPKIQYKMYFRPQGDLRSIVGLEDVAQLLVEEHPDVFMSILDVLVYLQWMNPYWSTRAVDSEVENDWSSAIQLEMNTMAILFQIISRCHEIYQPELEGSIEISRKTLLTIATLTLIRLHSYLNENLMLDFLNGTSSNSPMSLHIPLHRTLSAILSKLVLLPWKDAKNGFLSSLNFGFSEKEVLALMEHPLRIMVWMAQIRAGGWLRASEDFTKFELIYRGTFWHDQAMDMDILLLQFCAVARENMERAVFMRMAERFELKELVLSPQFEHKSLVKDKVSLLQDFIRLVLLVVRERRKTGMEEDDCLRYDVIQWLCAKNQTYSQLCRTLSAIPVDHEKLTAMLEKVAHFHLPKVQERGYYKLKAECWHEFDPLFAHFYSNELEDAQERAVHVGKLPHYWRIKSSGVVKQPFDRLVNLLHTEECHQLLWNVLNYVSAVVTKNSTAPACEALGVLALQMMGLALLDRRDNTTKLPASPGAWELPYVWSNDIFVNVHRRPQFNENTRLMEWRFHEFGPPSLVDLLWKLQDLRNAPRLADSAQYILHLLGYVVGSKASPTDLQLLLVNTQEVTRTPKQVAPAGSSEKKDHDPLENKQRCCANEFAFYAPSGSDQGGHPSASLVSQKKRKREAKTLSPRKRKRELETLFKRNEKRDSESLKPKVEEKHACYEKSRAEKKIAVEKRLETMKKPTSANALRLLHLRRALRCVREAVVARGSKKAVEVEECREASKSPILASSAVEVDGGIVIRDEPEVLEPKHKIFLSHSGAQKDFVEQLCVDLERCDQYPFFDKRRSSLPIGKNFPKLIFEAIEQCEVGVVVFSEDFFTRSKWPMLELVAMTMNPKLVIIPVFLNISIEEVHDVKKREIWLSVWREWAKEDERLDVGEWCRALKKLRPLNSLVHNGVGEVSFRKKILNVVCKIVLPETRWRDSHIKGRSRLCKVLQDKIQQARPTNGYEPCLVGIYGVGGIGKTTICQALCNDYFTRMHGKVCHLELGSANYLELLHEALKKLSDKSHDVWSKWNESQCEDLLKREMQQLAVFLAIDNMCDSQKSLENANFFLRGRFGLGSVVIVTSRSLKVLTHDLGINENHCLEMPELELHDAKSLFLQHAKCDGKTLKEVSDVLVEQSIKRCQFKKSDGKSYHYHPLALKILGMYLGGTKYDEVKWKAELKVLDAFNPRREIEHPIFSILRKSFDKLLLVDKMIFIDIALYLPENSMEYKCNALEWLSMVHGGHVQEVLKVLKGLERKALIEDLGDGDYTKIGIHDLWHEFALLETRAEEFEFRRWIYEIGLSSALEESTPAGGLWQRVKRMCFLGNGLSHLESIKLDHFSNITVMKLVAPKVNQQLNLILDVRKLIELKSLELEMGYGKGIQVFGLRYLKNLLFLKLKDGGFAIDGIIDDIEHLRKLLSLVLTYFQSDRLPNLSNLISLEEVNFSRCRNVTTICGLSSRLSRLRVLILDGCEKLRNLGPSAGDLHTLQVLSLRSCVNLKEGQVIAKKRSQVFTVDHKYIGVRRWIEKLIADIRPRQMGGRRCKVLLSVYGTEKEAVAAFDVGKYYFAVQTHRFNFEAFPRLLGPPMNLRDLSREMQSVPIIRLARDYATTSGYARF